MGAQTRKSRGSITPSIESVSEIGAEHAFKAKSASLSAQGVFLLMIVLVFWWATVKKVNNMHLQNVVMQLRKVRSHPLLFDWPLDLRTPQPVVDKQLVDMSRKMMVLKWLLEALFERGHKVLVFSQFVTMLNVIEVSVPTLSTRHLFMDDGNDRIWRSSSNVGHCAK